MDNKPPGIRRLCVAFGLDEPSGGDAMATAVRRVTKTFAEVCTSMGLDRMLLNHHDTGDGQVGLLPVGIDEPRVVSSLVDGLTRALARLNTAGRASVRLRLAFHEGVTTLTSDGFGGNAVTKVRQLAASEQLRAALDECPRASLAIMLSDPVFEDIGHSGLPAEQFRRVEIADPRRTARTVAWIYVP